MAIKDLQQLLPWLAALPLFPKILVTVAILALTALLLALIWMPSQVEGKTGDKVIDGVQLKLAALEKPISESELVEALNPLFSRPAFYGMREENWNHFLFPLCKTRLILEQQVPNFRSSPQTREDLGRVIELMVQLQNEVASLYGPNFSVTQHIRTYGNDAKAFVDHLPRILTAPDPVFFDARDETIKEIRGILQPYGLTNW